MHLLAADAAHLAVSTWDNPWTPFLLCSFAAVLALFGVAVLTGMWLGQRSR